MSARGSAAGGRRALIEWWSDAAVDVVYLRTANGAEMNDERHTPHTPLSVPFKFEHEFMARWLMLDAFRVFSTILLSNCPNYSHNEPGTCDVDPTWRDRETR